MTTVHAIIPLSLLEALRNLDTPVEDGLDELAGEIVAKRLGLSATVAAQIARYQELARRSRRVPHDEAIAVFRLAGRRSDASLVFADAGRRGARHASRSSALPVRAIVTASPAAVSRLVGANAARRAARRVFAAELRPAASGAEVTLTEPIAIQALPDGGGCAYFGAAFTELLRSLTGFEGTMVHDRCLSRGEADCHWHAATVGGYE